MRSGIRVCDRLQEQEMQTRRVLVWQTAAVLMLTQSALPAERPGDLTAAMGRVRALLCERFLDPASGRLFDYVCPGTFRLASGMLPTADEVRREVPNGGGWGTPIENGPINGGIFLGALVDRLGTTVPSDPKLVLAVADGLLELAERSGRRGFLARGLLADRKTHYPNSSVDQYTKIATKATGATYWSAHIPTTGAAATPCPSRGSCNAARSMIR
jgi:hypothetical protein